CPNDIEPYQAQEYPQYKNLLCSYGLNPFMSVAVDDYTKAPPGYPQDLVGRCDWYGHRHPKVLGVKNPSEKILVTEIRWGWFPNWFKPNIEFGSMVANSEWFDWDWYRHHTR